MMIGQMEKSNWRRFGIASLLLLGILSLAGCGGGGGGSETPGSPGTPPGPNPAGNLLEGRAADGYLVNAVVFLDRNGNKLPDADEPQTLTGNGGYFSLPVPSGEESLYPVVVQAVPGQTYDEDGLLPVTHGYTLETPVGRHGFISPLTTLVKKELDKSAILKAGDAETLVRTRFGLDDTISLWGDYVISSRAAVGGQPWARAQQTARVLAELDGILLAEFRQNLGGVIAPADFSAATIVIGDLLMANAPDIALALGDSVTPLAKSESAIVEDLLAKIDLTTLNQGLLRKYQKQLAERPAVWDAVPPVIVTRTPKENTAAPVTTTVAVTFNEALDPASLGSTPISLRGGGRSFAGQIAYDAAQNRLTFVPAEPLYALTDFLVEVAPTVADLNGNALGTSPSWTFSTMFNLSPPPLPDF